jgi:hypothetical protein
LSAVTASPHEEVVDTTAVTGASDHALVMTGKNTTARDTAVMTAPMRCRGRKTDEGKILMPLIIDIIRGLSLFY